MRLSYVHSGERFSFRVYFLTACLFVSHKCSVADAGQNCTCCTNKALVAFWWHIVSEENKVGLVIMETYSGVTQGFNLMCGPSVH